jgi:DNA-binding CsgD family transcriptional regulator
LAAELWCAALRGVDPDGVARRSADLLDRTLPTLTRILASATAALIEADAGLFGMARDRLADQRVATAPVSAAGILDWVRAEATWLEQTGAPDATPADLIRSPLVGGLRRITAFWAAYDAEVRAPLDDSPEPIEPPVVIRETLDAWVTAMGGSRPSTMTRAKAALTARRFGRAARAWSDVARREQVRCLVASSLFDPDPAMAVPSLLEANTLAADGGFAVLLDRVDQVLQRHGLRATGTRPLDVDLTDRQRDVLALVASGASTRRIAAELDLSRWAVEATIRSASGRLGTHVRTVAAARLAAEARG